MDDKRYSPDLEHIMQVNDSGKKVISSNEGQRRKSVANQASLRSVEMRSLSPTILQGAQKDIISPFGNRIRMPMRHESSPGRRELGPDFSDMSRTSESVSLPPSFLAKYSVETLPDRVVRRNGAGKTLSYTVNEVDYDDESPDYLLPSNGG